MRDLLLASRSLPRSNAKARADAAWSACCWSPWLRCSGGIAVTGYFRRRMPQDLGELADAFNGMTALSTSTTWRRPFGYARLAHRLPIVHPDERLRSPSRRQRPEGPQGERALHRHRRLQERQLLRGSCTRRLIVQLAAGSKTASGLTTSRLPRATSSPSCPGRRRRSARWSSPIGS